MRKKTRRSRSVFLVDHPHVGLRVLCESWDEHKRHELLHLDGDVETGAKVDIDRLNGVECAAKVLNHFNRLGKVRQYHASELFVELLKVLCGGDDREEKGMEGEGSV